MQIAHAVQKNQQTQEYCATSSKNYIVSRLDLCAADQQYHMAYLFTASPGQNNALARQQWINEVELKMINTKSTYNNLKNSRL
jgi:hypothetical protein